MSFEHKDNSGSIFKNGYKTKPEHPDHQGSCKVVCESCGHKQEMKISAWINLQKDNVTKYFGLSFSKPQPKKNETPVDYTPDDDIPF